MAEHVSYFTYVLPSGTTASLYRISFLSLKAVWIASWAINLSFTLVQSLHFKIDTTVLKRLSSPLLAWVQNIQAPEEHGSAVGSFHQSPGAFLRRLDLREKISAALLQVCKLFGR